MVKVTQFLSGCLEIGRDHVFSGLGGEVEGKLKVWMPARHTYRIEIGLSRTRYIHNTYYHFFVLVSSVTSILSVDQSHTFSRL